MSYGGAKMKIIHASIQNYYTQTGVGNDPIFMWKYDTGVGTQTAYKIDIYCKNALIFSTGKIMSDEQNNIGIKINLDDQTKYSYNITVWDEDDIEVKSDKYFFITGMRDVKANWISNGTAKPFLARKKFYYSGGDAILSVCAAGQFDVHINGEKLGEYVYQGSQTDFNKHIHYYTYDISNVLKCGENEILIKTANGWYIGDTNSDRHFYTMGMGYEPYGKYLAVLAQIKLSTGYIVSDESWDVSVSKTTLANIFGSEDIDNRITFNWLPAAVLQDTAPKGEIIPITYPPVVHRYKYNVKSVDKERMIFDFGQNMTSQFYMKIKGKCGQKIKVIPAEKLDKNGDIIQTVNTYSILTLSGGIDEFNQRFSLNGARWYKIEGAEYNQIIAFISYFTTTSANQTGYFKCSDDRYNKIYNIILKAIESNLNHLHTDCPTIEKQGWLEPNHLMARAIMYNKNVDTLWSKIAMDMRDSQYTKDEFDIDKGEFRHEYKYGLIPSIAPRYAKFIRDCGSGSFWDIIPWGSSIILAGYEQYLFYGNKQVLEDNYESAVLYLNYLTDQYENYSKIYNKNTDEKFICAGLGDWGIRQNEGESRENIETAFYYHDIMTLSKISKILNKGDENRLLEMAKSVKKRYNSSLLKIDGDKIYYKAYDNGEVTQSNQAIPLYFGLVPDEYRNDIENTLVSLCNRNHLKCGEIGLVYILRCLSKIGRNDIIHEMITKKNHPSYLRFVENGETTLPEFWRDDARSRNHDMMGHIMEWFFTDVAGITSSDAFKTVSISPKCTDFIKSFECEFDSIRGKIYVKYENGKMDISLPANTQLTSSSNLDVEKGAY